MERFVIIVNGFQPLTIITKRSILGVAVVLDPPLLGDPGLSVAYLKYAGNITVYNLQSANPLNSQKNLQQQRVIFSHIHTLSAFFSSDGYDSTDVEYEWWNPTRKEFPNVKIYSKDMQNYHVTEAVKSKNRTIYNHGKEGPGKFRSSHRRCSVRKGALRDFAKFTGKYLCQSLFFNKFSLISFLISLEVLWRRCFPVNFTKILRTSFLQNTFGRLLLEVP